MILKEAQLTIVDLVNSTALQVGSTTITLI